MGRVTSNISMSLDGFIAGANDRPGNGMGDGGERLHDWVTKLDTWRQSHGLEGGETNADSEMVEDTASRAGAIVLGKRMYDNAEGWGDSPPVHKPVFVLTHHASEPLHKDGGTTYTFVSDGIERAIELAQAACGDKDVAIIGGASVIQQSMRAGLLEELQIHLVPILLGQGVRLFDEIDFSQVKLERTHVIDSPDVTHLTYRVKPERAAAS
jgi:dihydrofolate reductase